ncbi:MAG: energy transducer TonB [Candidatus Binatia bacterium]
MKLASFFLISVAFHVALLYVPLAITQFEAGKEELIPVAFLSIREANGPKSGGDGKAAGSIEKPKASASRKIPRASQGMENKNGDLARESEMVQAARLIDEQTVGDKPENIEAISFVEPVEAISIEPFGMDAESRPNEHTNAISQGGIEGGRGTGGLSGLGNSGTGTGSGGDGRGGFPGSTFARASYAHNPKPEYPERARREGWEGTVLLRVLVDRQGKPRRIEVSRGSGFETLDRAAMETVKNWRFHPSRYGEERMESWVKVPIIFRLADRSS